jgi:hypothetical protein
MMNLAHLPITILLCKLEARITGDVEPHKHLLLYNVAFFGPRACNRKDHDVATMVTMVAGSDQDAMGVFTHVPTEACSLSIRFTPGRTGQDKARQGETRRDTAVDMIRYPRPRSERVRARVGRFKKGDSGPTKYPAVAVALGTTSTLSG